MQEIEKYECRLKFCLADDERKAAQIYLENLAKSFDKMEKIDTQNVKPLVNVLNIKSVLRQDIEEKTTEREEILKNAPEQYEGYFQVPKTLE